jgi:hypothetical protein
MQQQDKVLMKNHMPPQNAISNALSAHALSTLSTFA